MVVAKYFMIIFYASFLRIILFKVNASIDIKEISVDSTMQITPCILKLCEKYFRSKKKTQGSLAIVNLTPDASPFQRNVLASLNENDDHELAVMVKDARKKHWNASHVTEKAKNYFMLLSDSSELSRTIKQLHALPTWNPLAQVVVYITQEMSSTDLEVEMRNIFEELHTNGVYNVNIMTRKYHTNVIQVITWFPYEGTNCADRIIKLRIIDECEYVEDVLPEETTDDDFNVTSEEDLSIAKRFKYNWNSYFQDWVKIPDTYNGCPLSISSGNWLPYTVYEPNVGFTKGTEVFMVHTMTERMNMKPIYTLMNITKMNYFGSKENAILFYSDILEGVSDIMIGGLTENSISRKMLSSSIPYFQDDITFCVGNAALVPSWTNVFAIFNLWIWLFNIFLLYATGYLLRFFSQRDTAETGNIVWACLQSLAVTLYNYGLYNPRRFYIRFYMFCLMIYGMHFYTAYSSFLITVLTRPRYQVQVSSLPAAVESEYHFVGSENSLNYFSKDDAQSTYVRRMFTICPDIDVCLAHVKSDSQLGVAVSRQHARNSPLIDENDMFCFSHSQNIYSYSVSMLVKRDYHLLPKINAIIRTIHESGLLGKWEKDSEVSRVYVDEGDGATDGGIVLSINHVQGAFIVLGFGLVLSAIAFLTEWLIFLAIKHRGATFLKRIERMLCFD